MDEEYVDVSAGSIAASIGTVFLAAFAVVALWDVGVVLAVVGVRQPGVLTGGAVGYTVSAGVAPLLIARRLRRSGASWRRTIAAWAALVVVVSALFFPFAAAAWGL